MDDYDGAVCVQTRTRPPGAGPFAPMLTAAGWAAASAARWGAGWIWTPAGPMSPEEARDAASQAADETALGGSRRPPEWVVTLAKDVLTAGRGLLGSRSMHGPWDGKLVPFVWQRHDPFQSVGLKLAAQLERPLVMAVHAIHVDEAGGWGVGRPVWGRVVRSLGELRLLRRGNLLACVSEEVADVVLRYLPERSSDVVVIGSGIDRAHFRRDGVARRGTRELLGIPPASFVIGWHGSFRRFHGLDDLVHAYAQCWRKLPPSHLLLVGHGVQRSRILDLARDLGIADRVISPGEVVHAQIPDYLSAMDIGVVLADANDTFHYSPLKLREYQASELPVIASYTGELKALEDGRDALLVEPGDQSAIASALVGLAEDRELRSRLAAAGSFLANEHSWDSKLGELVSALQTRGCL